MAKKKPTAIDVLRRMRSILRKGWTQHAFARSASERPVESLSQRAVTFCLLGAKNRAVCDLGADLKMERQSYKLLMRCVPDGSISAYNDAKGRTKPEVLKVVECAIKKATAKAEQQRLG